MLNSMIMYNMNDTQDNETYIKIGKRWEYRLGTVIGETFVCVFKSRQQHYRCIETPSPLWLEDDPCYTIVKHLGRITSHPTVSKKTSPHEDVTHLNRVLNPS